MRDKMGGESGNKAEEKTIIVVIRNDNVLTFYVLSFFFLPTKPKRETGDNGESRIILEEQ